jgi:hypothetical protein
VEFIGREKARVYLQCMYCKVKQWIQRKFKSYNQIKMCMYVDIWWIYMVTNPNSTLLLENISLFLKLGNTC